MVIPEYGNVLLFRSSRGRRLLSGSMWRSITAFGLPFMLYMITLSPTIYNLDSAELTTAAATGGLVRATGYPLYLILGYLWSFLPIGDVGYRMNMLSAVFGALTIMLLERILRRWRISLWATIGALGLLACAPYFWALSLIVEVYTLHTALMAGLLLLALRWKEQPTPARLAGFSLVTGLSLGHHAATVLLLPGFIWYFLTTAPRRVFAPFALGSGVGGLLLGCSVYLYLPLRYLAAPAFNYAGHYDANGVFVPLNLLNPSDFWWLVSGRAFARQMLGYNMGELWNETLLFGQQLGQAFFVLGLGPGLLGCVILFRRDWRFAGMLALLFIGNASFYISYRVLDKATMFLPNYVIWALWLGVGYEWLMTVISEEGDGSIWRRGLWLLRGGIVGLSIVVMAWNWRLVDQSSDWSTRERGETILREVQPNALIFGWWDTVPLIEYLQLVEGQRPDVQVINRFLIPHDAMIRLIERESTRRPVYIDTPTEELFKTMKVQSSGVLFQVRP